MLLILVVVVVEDLLTPLASQQTRTQRFTADGRPQRMGSIRRCPDEIRIVSTAGHNWHWWIAAGTCRRRVRFDSVTRESDEIELLILSGELIYCRAQHGKSQKLWSLPKFSPSSIVSGRMAPNVSGNISPTTAPIRANIPRMVNGKIWLKRAYIKQNEYK